MNPILRLLLGTAYSSGIGERSGFGEGDLKSLTDALKAEKDKESPKMAPMERIAAAFDMLKNMHQSAPQAQVSPLDNAQWPFGPVGAPSQAQAQAPHPPQAPQVPMPMARPQEAPQADQPALMSFFERNNALQKDPMTGEYLDPTAAAKASPGIFQGLFT
jgi:hypothetical protein